MQRILLLRALADLRAAKYGINTGDEYDLQVAAFHLQQCVEKTLKQTITDCGGNYAETYEIASLIAQVLKWQTIVSQDMLESIARDEALLPKWEWATRYDDPYMATRSLVLELYDKVLNFYEEVVAGLHRLDSVAGDARQGDTAPVKEIKLDS